MTTTCIDTINPKVVFADAKEIWIAVALLQKHIAKQLLSNANIQDTNLIHIIVGIDLPTEPSAIETLYNAGCDIQVCKSNVTFHPKVYVVKRRNGKYSSIVGSANATTAGFTSNIELSVHSNDIRFSKSVIDWFNHIDKRTLRNVDKCFIETYKQEFVDRQQKNLDQKHQQIKQRIQQLWNTVNEYNKRELIQQLTETLSKISSSHNFRDRDKVVEDLRAAMDVKHGFRSFNSKQFVEIAELGRIRSSQRNTFYQDDTINAIKRAYTASEEDLANAIDNLCSCKDIGIGYASKIMCVRNPKKFMVINGPAKEFLKRFGVKGISGKISGKRYLEISQEIAGLIKDIPGLNNFAHFDCLIWN